MFWVGDDFFLPLFLLLKLIQSQKGLYVFPPGLVGTSQSDQKQFLETEKDSLIINKTKSPLFLKSSKYANLYEKFTLPLSLNRAPCS